MEEESDLSLELAIHRAGWTSTRRPGKPGGNMAGRAARQVGLPEGGPGDFSGQRALEESPK